MKNEREIQDEIKNLEDRIQEINKQTQEAYKSRDFALYGHHQDIIYAIRSQISKLEWVLYF